MRGQAVIALAIVVTACAAVSADTSRAGGPGSLRCLDVAARVGLEFVGAYGQVQDGDRIEVSMQRNLGNGAAVGDY
ncbi:MAG: hypothetical protein ABIZ57_06780, partial [Candidatus Limnocylindria bacterium]